MIPESKTAALAEMITNIRTSIYSAIMQLQDPDRTKYDVINYLKEKVLTQLNLPSQLLEEIVEKYIFDDHKVFDTYRYLVLGRKISAIKHIRMLTGLGLADAKNIADSMYNAMTILDVSELKELEHYVETLSKLMNHPLPK